MIVNVYELEAVPDQGHEVCLLRADDQ